MNSPAQISRWETGATRVDYRTVRRYEQVLDLPAHGLVAMADLAGGRGGPRLDRRLDPDDPEFHRRSGQLLDRALTGGPMDGAAWDDLTAHLAALPAVYLHPPDAWADLAHRLLSEMIVADGLSWAQREAALGRLLRHPSSGASTIAACAGFATDPAHQVFAEPLSDLHVSDHPDAVRLMLAQVGNPSSNRALYGALRRIGERRPRLVEPSTPRRSRSRGRSRSGRRPSSSRRRPRSRGRRTGCRAWR